MTDNTYPSTLEVGDKIQCQGAERKVVKLIGIVVAFDGVEDTVCVPIDATIVEVSKISDEERQWWYAETALWEDVNGCGKSYPAR
jgi:hypothetical protein